MDLLRNSTEQKHVGTPYVLRRPSLGDALHAYRGQVGLGLQGLRLRLARGNSIAPVSGHVPSRVRPAQIASLILIEHQADCARNPRVRTTPDSPCAGHNTRGMMVDSGFPGAVASFALLRFALPPPPVRFQLACHTPQAPFGCFQEHAVMNLGQSSGPRPAFPWRHGRAGCKMYRAEERRISPAGSRRPGLPLNK